MNPTAFKGKLQPGQEQPGKLWENIKGVTGETYNWPESTYIAEPPFFEGFE